MIDIGYYIEIAIEWLTEAGAGFFDALSMGVEGFIDGFQLALYAIPFYIFILLVTLLAWWRSGKGIGIFTLLGLLLIYGMGFWEETMQTLALVLSSTCLALLLGVPLGIWTAKSERCNQILRPVLDCMQTMPAFVYLIPAVLFFGLGSVPGAFATIIFAMPPVVRLTGLGIRQVPENIIEAARSFGATPATAFQGTASAGTAYYLDGYQPDHHDGAFHGSGICHDFGKRIGRSGSERHHANEDWPRVRRRHRRCNLGNHIGQNHAGSNKEKIITLKR